jgi:hypothetical protein
VRVTASASAADPLGIPGLDITFEDVPDRPIRMASPATCNRAVERSLDRDTVVDLVTMSESIQFQGVEPRWPMALAMGTAFLLLAALPAQLRLLPHWVAYPAAMLLPVLAALEIQRWPGVERVITRGLLLLAAVETTGALAHLVIEIIRPSGRLDGIRLLASSILLWAVNLCTFSLIFWQVDRGGPVSHWLFPDTNSAGGVPSEVRSTFVDYLFLGFSTATALGRGDALPITARAKLLMMLERAISIVTVIALTVLSRALPIPAL